MDKSIDRTITWRYALPYILILIASHAKKSYTDHGVDKQLKACLTDLVDQHEKLAKFYTDNIITCADGSILGDQSKDKDGVK